MSLFNRFIDAVKAAKVPNEKEEKKYSILDLMKI
ncbi:hypothetical protein JOC73_000652 [Alkaliphilus hydrothermalis]|uniref:Uncharacterized protein n=1 Tax=Alkaliphilus hydrothermalis TaxID=1482730 RepID=A0ABS2NMI5_9FIRM|nr:hypothetical protein [Alkaliphilus hydrothermalis]